VLSCGRLRRSHGHLQGCAVPAHEQYAPACCQHFDYAPLFKEQAEDVGEKVMAGTKRCSAAENCSSVAGFFPMGILSCMRSKILFLL